MFSKDDLFSFKCDEASNFANGRRMEDTNVHLFEPQGSSDTEFRLEGGEVMKIIALIDRKWKIIISIVALAICHCLYPIMNIVIGDIIDALNKVPTPDDDDFDMAIFKKAMREAITDAAIKLEALVLIMVAMTAISNIINAYLCPRYVTIMRKLMFESMAGQSVTYFDRTSTGILISRLSEDVTLTKEIFLDKTFVIVEGLTQAVTSCVIALVYNWRVSLLIIAAVPVGGLIYLVCEKWVQSGWRQFSDTSSKAAASAEQVITAFRTVKAFDNELHEADKYTKNLWSVYDVMKTTSFARAVEGGVSTCYVWLCLVGVIIYSSWLVIRDGGKLGSTIVLMFCLNIACTAAMRAFTAISDFTKARVSAAKILSIINSKPDIDIHDGEKMPADIDGKIEFDDVWFQYEGAETYALRGLTFTVNPGETVALVGESGCGKSTTLALLQRFYETNSGEIRIDGKNIKEIAQNSLRAQIAIVPQGPVLFSMSVRDNIRFARDDATDDEIAEAARLGNAHDFIMELNENYDTVVQPTGLSGGQKQRLCISRAILAKCPILLLDEATAALDTESEQLVQQSLESYRQGKTAIIVAHRLATVINADRIFVFKDGRIVESGTHDELISSKGIYSDLVKYQLQ